LDSAAAARLGIAGSCHVGEGQASYSGSRARPYGGDGPKPEAQRTKSDDGVLGDGTASPSSPATGPAGALGALYAPIARSGTESSPLTGFLAF